MACCLQECHFTKDTHVHSDNEGMEAETSCKQRPKVRGTALLYSYKMIFKSRHKATIEGRDGVTKMVEIYAEVLHFVKTKIISPKWRDHL